MPPAPEIPAQLECDITKRWGALTGNFVLTKKSEYSKDSFFVHLYFAENFRHFSIFTMIYIRKCSMVLTLCFMEEFANFSS
jgi:hypothetical protein